VRVAFDPAALPDAGWLVDGLAPEGWRDPGGAVPLAVDRSGYVDAQFHRPAISRVHGVGWTWPPRTPDRTGRAGDLADVP
jgi:hypothetical protein